MSDTSAAGLEALTGTLLGLSVITVGLRFYARRKTKAPIMADDWLMVGALVSFIAGAGCIFELVRIKALGYSTFSFTPAEIAAVSAKSDKLQIAVDVATILCLGCTKASALFFYKRIFCVLGPRTRVFNYIVYGSIGIVVAWVFTFEFMAGFQCQGHFSALWDPKTYAKYCTISWPFLYGLVISDVILDLWVLLLPIPNILRLHTSVAKKLSIVGIFLLAFVALGASLARMAVFIQIDIIGVSTFEKVDSEHILTKFFFFYMLECGISIIAINAPSLWPVFFKLGPDALLKMARSVSSLASGASTRNNSKVSKMSETQRSNEGRLRSDATDYAELYSGEHTNEAYAMRNVNVPDAPGVPKDKIHVKDSIHVMSSDKSSLEDI